MPKEHIILMLADLPWIDIIGGWEPLLGGLLIFGLRVGDMSADSLRILSMVRGYRIRAALFGVLEAALFIYAISQVLRPPMHWMQMAGYACGFGAGTFTGATIARWFTSNFVLLNVFIFNHGQHLQEIAADLRDKGYCVTTVRGEGHDGPLVVLFSVMKRELAERAMTAIRQIDDQAFVTLEAIDRAEGAYLPRLTGWRPSVRR